MKLLGLVGSNDLQPMHRALLQWVMAQFGDCLGACEHRMLAPHDLNLPLLKQAAASDIPPQVHALAAALDEADLVVLSLVEHRGGYTAAFQNALDWLEQVRGEPILNQKPLLLLSTARDRRGGSTVLTLGEQNLPLCGGRIMGAYSLPCFDELFDASRGIRDEAYAQELEALVQHISEALQGAEIVPRKEAAHQLEIGQPLPPWSVKPLADEAVPQLADFRGKPLLMLFYYLGCPGCKGRAIPYANRLVYEQKGVQVLGIHTRFNGKAYSDAEIMAANEELYVRFPVVRDQEEAQTFYRYQAGGTPHWVLVDAEGKLVYSLFGSDPNNALLRLDLKLAELLQVDA